VIGADRQVMHYKGKGWRQHKEKASGEAVKVPDVLNSSQRLSLHTGCSQTRSADSGGDEHSDLWWWSITGYPAETTNSCNTDRSIVNCTLNRPNQTRPDQHVPAVYL